MLLTDILDKYHECHVALCRDLSQWRCRIVLNVHIQTSAEHCRPFICTEEDRFDTGPVGRLVTDRKSAHWDGYQ